MKRTTWIGIAVAAIVAASLVLGAKTLACSGGQGHMQGHAAAGHNSTHAAGHQQHHEEGPEIGDESCQGLATKRQQSLLEVEEMDSRLADLMDAMESAKRQDKQEAAMAVIDELVLQRATLRNQFLSVQPMMTAHLREHMEDGSSDISNCVLYQEVASSGDHKMNTSNETASLPDDHAGHQH